jgi:hypothetical protein
LLPYATPSKSAEMPEFRLVHCWPWLFSERKQMIASKAHNKRIDLPGEEIPLIFKAILLKVIITVGLNSAFVLTFFRIRDFRSYLVDL